MAKADKNSYENLEKSSKTVPYKNKENENRWEQSVKEGKLQELKRRGSSFAICVYILHR